MWSATRSIVLWTCDGSFAVSAQVECALCCALYLPCLPIKRRILFIVPTGAAWSSLNAGQRQARKGLAPLYATSKPLVKRFLLNSTQHTFPAFFLVQVNPSACYAPTNFLHSRSPQSARCIQAQLAAPMRQRQMMTCITYVVVARL